LEHVYPCRLAEEVFQMKIIYIHQYFLTPSEGGATRSYHLAKGLVEAGIDVEMITSHSENFYDFKLIDGIKVHYLPVSYRQEFGFLKRIWAFTAFVEQAKKLLIKLPRPDFLYITSTPLTTGWIGLWAKKKLAIPYIFEVRDLWPEAPIQVGVIRNPILKKILFHLEAKIYRHALKIVALSPGIANAIREKAPGKIHLIPNFADTSFFYPKGKDPVLLKKFGLQPSFTIAYAGAIGQVNAVEEMLILAKMAQDNKKNYQFVVMGKGAKTGDLLQRAKELKLDNFYYFPFGSKEKVQQLLTLSDMAMVTFAHLPVLKTNSPNKFFDALAAGKGIIVNHKGWVYQLLKTYSLGIYFNPEAPEVAFEKLVEMASNPKLLSECQRNSRDLAENFFSKEIAVQRLLAVIDPEKFGKDFKDEVYILTA
jgi:glycosyltransferase involved in cell wall biosynthesis